MGDLGIIAYFREDERLVEEKSDHYRVVNLFKSLITSKTFSERYGYTISDTNFNKGIRINFAGDLAVENSCNFILYMRKLGFEAISKPGMPKNLFTFYFYRKDSPVEKIMRLMDKTTVNYDHALFADDWCSKHIYDRMNIQQGEYIQFSVPEGKIVNLLAVKAEEFFGNLRAEYGAESGGEHRGMGKAMSDKKSDGSIFEQDVDIAPPADLSWWESSEEMHKIWQHLDVIAGLSDEDSKTKTNTQDTSYGNLEVSPPSEPRAPESTTKRFVSELLNALRSSDTQQMNEVDAPTNEAVNSNEGVSTNDNSIRSPMTRKKVVQGTPLSPYVSPEIQERVSKTKVAERQKKDSGIAIIIIAALLGLLVVAFVWRFYYESHFKAQSLLNKPNVQNTIPSSVDKSEKNDIPQKADSNTKQ